MSLARCASAGQVDPDRTWRSTQVDARGASATARSGSADQVVAGAGINVGRTLGPQDDRVVPGPGKNLLELGTAAEDRHAVVSRTEADVEIDGAGEPGGVFALIVEDLVIAGAGAVGIPPLRTLGPHDDVVTAEGDDDVVSKRGADSVVTRGANEGRSVAEALLPLVTRQRAAESPRSSAQGRCGIRYGGWRQESGQALTSSSSFLGSDSDVGEPSEQATSVRPHSIAANPSLIAAPFVPVDIRGSHSWAAQSSTRTNATMWGERPGRPFHRR